MLEPLVFVSVVFVVVAGGGWGGGEMVWVSVVAIDCGFYYFFFI